MYNPYQQGYMQYPQYQMPQQPQQTSFIRVQNEMQAREWSVAPNCSATFIDDNAPYCYTKSMGVSQFDTPVFKKFRLVEEVETSQTSKNEPVTASETQSIDLSNYATKLEIERLQAIIDDIQTKIKELTDNESFERKTSYTTTASTSAESS